MAPATARSWTAAFAYLTDNPLRRKIHGTKLILGPRGLLAAKVLYVTLPLFFGLGLMSLIRPDDPATSWRTGERPPVSARARQNRDVNKAQLQIMLDNAREGNQTAAFGQGSQ